LQISEIFVRATSLPIIIHLSLPIRTQWRAHPPAPTAPWNQILAAQSPHTNRNDFSF